MSRINTQVNKNCLICKKIFLVIKCRKSTAKYCSRICSNKNPFLKKFGNRMKPIHQKNRKNLKSKSGPKRNRISLSAVHAWAKRRISKTKFCKDCKKVSPLDLANISQFYKRELIDWEWLCRRCHMIKDGRLLKFKQLHKLNKKQLKN